MAALLGVLIPTMMICASFGQTTDTLIEGFINSLFTTTLNPRSCGVQKQCVPFYRCKAVHTDDSICSYPDTCCNVANKLAPTSDNGNPAQYARCGYRNVGSKTTDGTDFGEFPWYASLMTAKEAAHENYFCNAVIIAPSVVLTTAYCAEQASEEFYVRVGEWIGMEKKFTQHRVRRVDKVITHERYDAGSLSNNIALLIVERPFQWEEKVRPVCLPDAKTKFDEARCYLPNWTKDVPSRRASQAILKRVNAPIVPLDQCLAKFREHLPNGIQLAELCAGGKEAKDYDVFSDGTPLVCPVPGAEDRYFLVGISSHSPQLKDATERSYIPSNVPRAYVKVALQLEWLNEKLSQRGIDLSYLRY